MLGEKLVMQALPALSAVQTVFSDLAKDEEVMAVASRLLNGTLEAGIILFQTLAVVGSDVGFVFQGVGREIAPMAAQLVSLAQGDMAGFHTISVIANPVN